MKEHAARVDEGERGHGAPGHHGSDGRTHGSSRIQQLLIVLLSVAGLGCAMNMEGGEADPAADAPAPFQEDDAIYDQAEVQAAYAEPSAPDASDDSIGSSQAAIQNGYVSTHSDGLVRFDFSGGGRCSGFLVGPNMITTAAHCVDDQILSQYSRGTAGGMKWGYIYARVVYKPGNEGTFCLNRACREDGETRYMYFRAWFDAGYSGTGDTASDFAIVTALEGTDFVTYPDDDWEPAPRALNSSDYLRVLRHQVPTSQWLYAWGYGRLNDSTTTVTPHWGPLKLNYWGPSHVRGDAGTDTARICKGDSGGPLVHLTGPNYAIGVASNMSGNEGACPERGDPMRWNRPGSKIALYNYVMNWSGRDDCTQYYNSNLPNEGLYYRCW